MITYYVYCADVYCEDCGKALCEELTNQGKAPNNPDDDYSFDSDEYPKKFMDTGESDCVQHCGNNSNCLNAIDLGDGWKIGCWLENDLTSYGLDELQKLVNEDHRLGCSNEVTALWAKWYGITITTNDKE